MRQFLPIVAAVLASLVMLWLGGCAGRRPADAPAFAPGLHQRTVTMTPEQIARGSLLPAGAIPAGSQTYPYALFIPAGTPPPGGWPVILFLHGSGERGSDGLKQTAVGLYPAVQKNPERWPAIVVMPQLPEEDRTPGSFFMRWRHRGDLALAALDDALALCAASGPQSRANPKRVALTGLSNGGQGAWQLAALHPERFTRVMPVAASSIVPLVNADGTPGPMLLNGRPLLDPLPTPQQQRAWIASLARQRIWATHGLADPVVPHAHLETMAAALRAAGAGEATFTTTYFPGVDHNSWDVTYQREDVARWLTAK